MEETLQVVPGVHAIDAVGAKALLMVEERLTLVDAGAPGSAGRILAYIVGLGHSPTDVERIILTHAHIDHVGSLADLRTATGAEVCVHESEADWVMGNAEPPPLVANPLIDQMLRPVVRTRPAHVDRLLRDGDVLPMFGGTHVVHVPGHTRGSIALHVPSRRLLIVGDALQVIRGRLAPPSRLFTGDMSLARRSMARLAHIDADTLIFSHYRPRRHDRWELAALADRLEKRSA